MPLPLSEYVAPAGRVDVVDNIRSAKWMKLIINAMTMGIKGIANMTSGEIFKVPGMREIMLRAGEESLVIGQELGYRNVAIIGLRPEDIEGSNRLCELTHLHALFLDQTLELLFPHLF